MGTAIDLGSTRLKAARLDGSGNLEVLGSAACPPLSGSGLIREMGPVSLYDAATDELRRAAEADPAGTLAISSQRSSFLLWDRDSGKAATPVISWQDRRAEPWCRSHPDWAERIAAATGLVLSPHYAGPKLASLFAASPDLRTGMAEGRLLFGTLETYLIWRWSEGAAHRTDLSMAARTQMVDLAAGDWSGELLDLFDVPRRGLPDIVPTTGHSTPLPNGLTVTATVSDQAAGALATLGDARDTALVNLGTGGFVLHGTPSPGGIAPGLLVGPTLGDDVTRYAVEGTINGIGPLAEGMGPGPTELPQVDQFPAAFCLPDANGVGAPHWRAEVSTTFSPQAKRLPLTDLRRVALEGIVFRVREILEAIGQSHETRRIFLSGGLSAEPFVGEALAACTGLPVFLVELREASLLGAARLGAGLDPFADPALRPVVPEGGAYLDDKYHRWRSWLGALLA